MATRIQKNNRQGLKRGATLRLMVSPTNLSESFKNPIWAMGSRKGHTPGFWLLSLNNSLFEHYFYEKSVKGGGGNKQVMMEIFSHQFGDVQSKVNI